MCTKKGVRLQNVRRADLQRINMLNGGSTMLGRTIENNKVKMVCKIVSGFTYSHEIFGEKFYLFDGEVVRKKRARRHHPGHGV